MPDIPEDRKLRIIIGTVNRPHGRRGEVRVSSHFDPEDFPAEVRLCSDEWSQDFLVGEARTHSDVILLKLVGVDSRPEAEALRGARIEVDRSEMPELPEDSFYLDDLIGCRVVSVDGRDLGHIAGLLDEGNNAVLKVEGDDSDWMLPAAREMIREVRIADGIIIVDLPEGLVDLS